MRSPIWNSRISCQCYKGKYLCLGFADCVCCVHRAADCGAHAGGDDLHLHPPPRGGCLQSAPPDLQHRVRVPPPQDGQNHWAGLGLQHCARHSALPRSVQTILLRSEKAGLRRFLPKLLILKGTMSLLGFSRVFVYIFPFNFFPVQYPVLWNKYCGAG